jgi:signal transduction histidine kinase
MIVSAVWLAPALFAVVDLIGQRRLAGEPPPDLREILWSGGDWAVYALLTPPIFWVSRRWPILLALPVRRTLLHLLFALLFCVGWATSGKVLEVVLALVFDAEASSIARAIQGTGPWSRAGLDWLSWVLITLPFGCVVYFSIAGAAHAIRYFVEAREREVQLARMAEQLSSARFAALQAQVNPHFLFNTLNTNAVLVRDDDRKGAVDIVERLSELLRATLNRRRANEVRLDEELDVVRQYLAIEQARFSDRLRVSWKTAGPAGPAFTDDAVDIAGAAVPSFAVQHLVENAIRHGVARREEAGLVEIAARRDGDTLVIAVRDDGPGISVADALPPGHGLADTRERLEALYGSAASLHVARAPDGGTIATLRLPYRNLSPEAGHVK